MLRAAGNGAKFESPLSHEYIHVVGFSCIDDKDIITFNMREESINWTEDRVKCKKPLIDGKVG